MEAVGADEEMMPAFFRFTRKFSGLFLSVKSVRNLLISLHAVSASSDVVAPPVQGSFNYLLQPSMTTPDLLSIYEDEGYMDWPVQQWVEDEEELGVTVQSVIQKLEKVSTKIEAPFSPGAVEERLLEFEAEIGMPEEGRGKLYGVISSGDETMEKLLMFLATYFNVAPPMVDGKVSEFVRVTAREVSPGNSSSGRR